jgi:uncharacterized protein YecA (UPF0149 family)
MSILADAPTVITGAQTANYLVTIIVAIVSGTGGWSVLQFVLNRTGRKAEAARLTAQIEQNKIDSEEADHKRRLILSDFQARAQQIAVESATSAYERVQAECESCRDELREMRRAAESLIRAVEDIVFELTLTETDLYRLRTAISIARDSL